MQAGGRKWHTNRPHQKVHSRTGLRASCVYKVDVRQHLESQRVGISRPDLHQTPLLDDGCGLWTLLGKSFGFLGELPLRILPFLPQTIPTQERNRVRLWSTHGWGHLCVCVVSPKRNRRPSSLPIPSSIASTTTVLSGGGEEERRIMSEVLVIPREVGLIEEDIGTSHHGNKGPRRRSL